jgi:hypothetical protein
VSPVQMEWALGYDAAKAAAETPRPRAVQVGEKCHQRVIREGVGARGLKLHVRLSSTEELAGGFSFGRIPIDLGRAFIERYEWLGNAGRALIFYGMWRDGELHGVEAFTPMPYGLSSSLGDAGRADRGLYLTRGACSLDAGRNGGTKLIGACLRDLRRRKYWLVVAFSDGRAGETGAVYRAANAQYGGITTTTSTYYFWHGRWVTANHLSRMGVKPADIPGVPRSRESAPKRRYFWVLNHKARKHLGPSWIHPGPTVVDVDATSGEV